HLAHRECPRTVGKHPPELHAQIERYDVTVLYNAPPGRNAMNDLLVDRDAHRPGKAIQALESGRGAIMAADEILRNRVQFAGGDSGAEVLLEFSVRGGQNSTALRHDLDLSG